MCIKNIKVEIQVKGGIPPDQPCPSKQLEDGSDYLSITSRRKSKGQRVRESVSTKLWLTQRRGLAWRRGTGWRQIVPMLYKWFVFERTHPDTETLTNAHSPIAMQTGFFNTEKGREIPLHCINVLTIPPSAYLKSLLFIFLERPYAIEGARNFDSKADG